MALGDGQKLCRKPVLCEAPREVVAMAEAIRENPVKPAQREWPQLLLPFRARAPSRLTLGFFPAPRRRRDRAGNHVFVRSFVVLVTSYSSRIVAGLPTAPA